MFAIEILFYKNFLQVYQRIVLVFSKKLAYYLLLR